MNFSTIQLPGRAARLGVRGAILGLALAGILTLQAPRAWAGDPDEGGSSGSGSDETPPVDEVPSGEEEVPPVDEVPSGAEDGDGVINTATGGAGGVPKPAKNHRPVAFPSNLAGRKGVVLNGRLRMNDRDKNDVLTVRIVRQPTKGTVVVGAGGQFIYTPKTAFTGRDRFGFQVSDGKSLSKPRRVEMKFRAPKAPKPATAKVQSPAPSAGSS